MKRNLLYFAWVRERIGEAGETIQSSANTINELIDELCERDPRYAAAFADRSVIRAALDQTLAPDLDAPLNDAQEVAFFPPMTGG